MTDDALRAKILQRLHDIAGLCGHCGKRKCGGRTGHSILPERLKTDDVLAAINVDAKVQHD